MAHTLSLTQQLARELLAAERAYSGGGLSQRLAEAQRHTAMVAQWLVSSGRDAAATQQAPAPPLAASRLIQGIELVSAARVRAARAPVLLSDGAGVILLPANRILIAAKSPLFTAAYLSRYAGRLPFREVNPLTALRWTLTDALLRLNALNAPVGLNVVDDQGAIVVAPYAHGFAIGSSALYTRAYTYAQPSVNVGFDDVALKVLSALISARSGLSYAADVTAMQGFAAYLPALQALLAANDVSAQQWQALYQASDVLGAVLALIRRTRRRFGQDPNPTHVGANVDENAYGYGAMKAISQRDTAALSRFLDNFALPRVAAIPTLVVPVTTKK